MYCALDKFKLISPGQDRLPAPTTAGSQIKQRRVLPPLEDHREVIAYFNNLELGEEADNNGTLGSLLQLMDVLSMAARSC
jgi:hypothetical protein